MNSKMTSNKKAILAGMLIFPLLLVLAGCGQEEKPLSNISENTKEQPVQTQYYEPGAASLLISPNAVKPGGNLEIMGAGFLPGEILQIEILGAFHDQNLILTPGIEANKYGAFAASSQLNPECTAGIFTLRVSGTKGSLVTEPVIIVLESK